MNTNQILKSVKRRTFLLLFTTVLSSSYGMSSTLQKAEGLENLGLRHSSSKIAAPVPRLSMTPFSKKDPNSFLKDPISPPSRPSSPLKDSGGIPNLSRDSKEPEPPMVAHKAFVTQLTIFNHPNYLTSHQTRIILDENPFPLGNLTSEYVDDLRAHRFLKTNYISLELLNPLFRKAGLQPKAQDFALTVIEFMYNNLPAPKHGASFVNKGFLECMIKGSLKAEGIDVQNDDVNRQSVLKILRKIFKDTSGASNIIQDLENELKKKDVYFLEKDFILEYLEKKINFNKNGVAEKIQYSLLELEQMDIFSKIFAFSGHIKYFDPLPHKFKKRIKPFPCTNCSASHVQHIENLGSK